MTKPSTLTFKYIFSLLSLILLCSCANIGLENPRVNLTNISLGKSNSFLGSSLIIDLKITNPNGIPLPLTAMNYSLGIGGAKLLSGTTGGLSTIEAYGSQNVSLNLDINILELPKLLSALSNSNEISYQFNGSLKMKGLIPNIPVSKSGLLSDAIK